MTWEEAELLYPECSVRWDLDAHDATGHETLAVRGTILAVLRNGHVTYYWAPVSKTWINIQDYNSDVHDDDIDDVVLDRMDNAAHKGMLII